MFRKSKLSWTFLSFQVYVLIINIAILPAFSGFEGLNDRVSGLLEVFCRVLAWPL